MLIPLKLKYRNPNHKILSDGTRVFQAGRFGSKSNHQGTKSKSTNQGTGVRRRAYNTHYTP
jgi:hypothetical protein